MLFNNGFYGQDIVMAFSPPEYCRLFAQKKAYQGGVRTPPLATPLNEHGVTKNSHMAQLTIANSNAQRHVKMLCTSTTKPLSTSNFYVDFKNNVFKDQKIETHLSSDVLRFVR